MHYSVISTNEYWPLNATKLRNSLNSLMDQWQRINFLRLFKSLNRFSLTWACFPIKCKICLISFVVEIATKYEPIASDSVIEVIKNSNAIIMHEILNAIKYPLGFFVSNGNLEYNWQDDHMYRSSSHFIESIFYHMGMGSTNESLSESFVVK